MGLHEKCLAKGLNRKIVIKEHCWQSSFCLGSLDSEKEYVPQVTWLLSRPSAMAMPVVFHWCPAMFAFRWRWCAEWLSGQGSQTSPNVHACVYCSLLDI